MLFLTDKQKYITAFIVDLNIFFGVQRKRKSKQKKNISVVLSSPERQKNIFHSHRIVLTFL